MEQIPAIVYVDVADEEMSTTYVSPQIQAILGYTAQEYIDDPQLWENILHPDDRENAMATYLRGRESGDPFVFEYRLLARDGRRSGSGTARSCSRMRRVAPSTSRA